MKRGQQKCAAPSHVQELPHGCSAVCADHVQSCAEKAGREKQSRSCIAVLVPPVVMRLASNRSSVAHLGNEASLLEATRVEVLQGTMRRGPAREADLVAAAEKGFQIFVNHVPETRL